MASNIQQERPGEMRISIQWVLVSCSLSFSFSFFLSFSHFALFAFCIMPHFTIAIAVANTNPGSCKLKAPLFYLGSVFAIGEIAGGLDLLARVVGLWFVGFWF